MKLNQNLLKMDSVEIPQAGNSNYYLGSTKYYKPIQILISLAKDADYQATFQLFIDAGVKSQDQERYYKHNNQLLFNEREDIVIAIDVLAKHKLIPDDDAGKKLLDFHERMRSQQSYDFDVETVEILKYQSRHASEANWTSWTERLLQELKQKLASISQKSWCHVAERTSYLNALEQLIAEKKVEELSAHIIEGIKKFESDPEDLAFVLKRTGENVMRRGAYDLGLVYRRATYSFMVKAQESCRISKDKYFRYEVEGDPQKAFQFWCSAIQTADNTYLGPTEAHYQLGLIYVLGLAPLQQDKNANERLAVHHFKEAAQHEHYHAYVYLGKMAMQGRGFPKVDTKLAVFYLSKAIGNDFVSRHSEPLGYLLELVDKKDPPALDYLKEKLNYHKTQLLKYSKDILEFIQKNGCKALTVPIENGRSVECAGQIHLHQIHFLANDGETQGHYCYGGYIIAKQVLIEVYQELLAACQRESIENDFSEEITRYQEKIKSQLESEAPKPKTPAELRRDAFTQDNVEAFKSLISAEDCKNTLLCNAASHASEKIVDYLLTQGVNVNATEKNKKETPLIKLCILAFLHNENPRLLQRLRIAKKLIAQGAEVNFNEGKDYAALHYAAMYEFNEMIILLLEAGAKVDIEDMLKRTPLELLIDQSKESASTDTLEILLMSGADINHQDSSGFRPFTRAQHYPVIRKLLREYGTPTTELSKNESGLASLLARFSGTVIQASPPEDLTQEIIRKPKRSIAQVKQIYRDGLYQDGVNHFKEKEYTAAIHLFEGAAFLFEENSERLAICLYSLASAYYHLENFTAAQQTQEKSLAIRPTHSQSQEKLAHYQQVNAADQKALQAKALAAKSNYVDAIDLYLQAIAEMKKCVSNGNVCRSTYHFELAQCFQSIGDKEQSIHHCNQAVLLRQMLLGYHHPVTTEAREKLQELRVVTKQASNTAAMGFMPAPQSSSSTSTQETFEPTSLTRN